MSSPSSSTGPAPPTSRKLPRANKRNKLRNATFIIPSTRERVKRQITLRNPASFDGASRQSPLSASSNDILPLGHHDSDFKVAYRNTLVFLRWSWQWLNSPLGRGVLKCSIAYLLASLATYFKPISNWLGKQDGKHIVATTVVYFHPARSAGSMLEADIYGVLAFLYFSFISVSSMAVSVLCETQFGLIELGYVLVLVVFCGGGLGFVGWVKQAMNSPLVNVACSLTSLSIISVLTKENAVQTGVFSNHKIVQVMKMVVLAIIITTCVNLVLFPTFARKQLRQTMIDTTDVFCDMLNMITRSFLNGTESDLKSSKYEATTRRHKSVLTQLTKNLREAKAEHFLLGTESHHYQELKLVNCMQRLSQAMGGLRSAAMTQFTLLKDSGDDISSTTDPSRHQVPQMRGTSNGSTLKAKPDRFLVLSAIHEAPDESSETDDTPIQSQSGNLSSNGRSSNGAPIPMAQTPADIFARFISYLGPSMKSLAYTLSQILDELPFGEGPRFEITLNDNFRNSLDDSLKLYAEARAEALQQLYKSKELIPDRPQEAEADFEEVAASCGYFSFSLQDFAEEMQQYLEILDDLKTVSCKKKRSWNWLRFWSNMQKADLENGDPERQHLINHPPEVDVPQEVDNVVIGKRYIPNAAAKKSKKQSVFSRVLKGIRFLQRDDIRFAIKVGAGAAIWAMFAFIPETRPIYAHWRGEWGLLSFMLVCSMTIGASNTTGYARFIGTVMGAGLSVIVWFACQENPFALIFCGWVVSFACFYYIVGTNKGPLGRFLLLTYNLSTLYAYSLSQKDVKHEDDDEGGAHPIITTITLHRLTAVIAGIIWGLIITRVIWPISARKKFKEGLSVLWLRMGLIWKRDPLSALLEGQSSNAYMDIKEEFALQRYVSRLDSMRNSATGEFELRGPFPQREYARIMDSTNAMLAAFHAMNVIIAKDLTASAGETALLQYTAAERTQLSSRISHLFQVLASSLKLEYPINDALPNTVSSRDRLLARIYQFRQDEVQRSSEDIEGGEIGERGRELAEDRDYELLYAYALVTGQLSAEILKVEREIEGLFGVLDEEMLRLA